jgi:hypothetical protein
VRNSDGYTYIELEPLFRREEKENKRNFSPFPLKRKKTKKGSSSSPV